MKHLLLSLFLLLSLPLAAQHTDLQRWTTHLSYRNGSQAIRAGQQLFGLYEGNLLIYDTQTTETQTVDRLSHGLSGRRIVDMAYSPEQQCLVLVYADSNIDLFWPRSGEVRNIPHLRQSTQQEVRINAINVKGNALLVATNIGLVWIDLAQTVIKGTFAIGECADATLFDGDIFAALTAGGTLVASPTANLNDRGQWKPFRSEKVSRLLATEERLYLVALSGKTNAPGLWMTTRKTATGERSQEFAGALGFTDAHLTLTGDVVCESWEVIFHYRDGSNVPQVVQKPNRGQHFEPDGKGGYWVSETGRGIYRAAVDNNVLLMEQPLATAGGFGPFQDRPYFMRYVGPTLFVTTGRNDPYDGDHVPQMTMRYDGQWSAFQVPTSEAGFVGTHFQDATSVAVSPVDPDRIFVTTNRTGVYLYNSKGEPQRQWTHDNSSLRSAVPPNDRNYPNYVRTDGAIFDEHGHLYVVNNGVDTTLWRFNGRSWKGFYHKELERAPNLEHTMFDSHGQLWVTSRRTVEHHSGGFYCLYDNDWEELGGRPSQSTYRSHFVNTDGARVPFQQAYAIAEDRDGALWLGTDQGIFLVSNPLEWHRDDFKVTQVKVPRNDGTNYADYLLAGVPVTAIAVDGANRKWVGTANDGLYLLSPDGITTEAHFTTDNSPLFSNNILSLAIHPTSSTLMVGTEEGLLAYDTQASAPQLGLSAEHLRVFPNPVRPDHQGDITLEGLATDTEVRVANASGVVVANGRSLGGTYHWDGRGYDGVRVGSGIYYFYLSGGSSGAVAKVAIVR